MDSDTIAAIATPLGAGGIGIVKISGPKAIPIALALLRSNKDPDKIISHMLQRAHLVDPATDVVVDEVLFVAMKGPCSYTREDVVEIQAHGSRCGLYKILELVFKQGARPAHPGEFTKRAFLNGRIDLTQAEAVADMVSAQTSQALEFAANQLRGDLQRAVEEVRSSMLSFLAEVEVAIDFPEDVEDIVSFDAMGQRLESKVLAPLEQLLANYDEGHVYKDGIRVAIAGRPNVGKSSLMNRLLDKERSIVATIPGTTRDFIEDVVNIKGVAVTLVDTAGIHNTSDEVEAIGIKFARERIAWADLVLFVVDGSVALNTSDMEAYSLVTNKKAILVINKSDIPQFESPVAISSQFPGVPWVCVSALHHEGINALKATIFSTISVQTSKGGLPNVVPNARHKACLDKAVDVVKTALAALKSSMPLDLVAVDLHEGWESLGEITGQAAPDALLDEIFSHFCIGK